MEPSIHWKGLSLVLLAPALGGFLYGYDIGATSFVLAFLLRQNQDETHEQNDETALCWWQEDAFASWQQGLMVAAMSAGALFGSHLVYLQHNRIDRRKELRIASILYFCGCVLNIASGTVLKEWSQTGWSSLVMGRFLFGIGVGFVMHGAPTYMAEMAPASIRGAVVSAKEAVIVFGIVCGYVAGDVVGVSHSHHHDLPWTFLYAVSCILTIPLMGLTLCIPRSMRWLLMHENSDNDFRQEAAQSMQFIYSGDIQQAFSELCQSIEASRMVKQTSYVSGKLFLSSDNPLLSAEVRPALLAALGLIAFQQLSGQPSIISYATLVFHAAGWNGHVTIITAILMLCMSTTTVYLVDRVGRKPLLSTCCTVLFLALLTLSYQFWDWRNGAFEEFGPNEKVVILIAMFAFIGGYQIGFGPITWLIVSEVFPGNVRGPATALGVELNYMLNFVVQFFVPIIQDQFGWGPTFGIFACWMAAALVFVKRYVPETRGMTLEEIEIQLRELGVVQTNAAIVSEDSENSLLLKKGKGVQYATALVV